MEKFINAVKPTSQFSENDYTVFRYLSEINYNLNLLDDFVKRTASFEHVAVLCALSVRIDEFVLSLKNELCDVIEKIQAEETISSAEE